MPGQAFRLSPYQADSSLIHDDKIGTLQHRHVDMAGRRQIDTEEAIKVLRRLSDCLGWHFELT